MSITGSDCVTKIPLTASDYSSLVSSAFSSLSRHESATVTGTAGGGGSSDRTTAQSTATRTTSVAGATSQGESAPMGTGAGGIKGLVAQAGLAAVAAIFQEL